MALISAAALMWRYGGVALAVGRTAFDVIKTESRDRDFKQWVSASGQYAADIAVNALPIPHQMLWYGTKQALKAVFPDQEITAALVSQTYNRYYDQFSEKLKKFGVDLSATSKTDPKQEQNSAAPTADSPNKADKKKAGSDKAQSKAAAQGGSLFEELSGVSALELAKKMQDMRALFNGDRLVLEFVDLKKLDACLFDPTREKVSVSTQEGTEEDEKLSRAVRSYLMKRYPERDITDERVAFAMGWYKAEISAQMEEVMGGAFEKLEKGKKLVEDVAVDVASTARKGASILRDILNKKRP